MKTRAAVLYQLNKPLVIEELEIPHLRPGQVLVKLLYSGICRSQINEITGLKGADHHLPHLLGHEGSGVVCAVGPGVAKIKTNDQVVISWIKGTGIDAEAPIYLRGDKNIFSGKLSTFNEYSVISENRLTKIPADIPADCAALLGCAIATGAGMVKNTLQAKEHSSLAIFGAGGVGSSAILGALNQNVGIIIAVDISRRALQFAKKLGATHTLLFSKTLESRIRKICPQGLDGAIEASGNKLAMEMAYRILNDRGKLVIAGNIRHDATISINPFDLIRGKRIVGTWGGETQPDTDIPYYIHQFQNGNFPINQLISKKFRLSQINEAISLLKKSAVSGRLLIDFT